MFKGIGTHPLNGRRIVRIITAAKIMAVSRRTIYNWIERGLIETVRLPSGTQYIYADTLVREVVKEVNACPATASPNSSVL